MSSIINILEAVTSYNDSWDRTFYFVATLVLLIGAFWTYIQVFVKPLKKKRKKLEENIIYNNHEDTIEESYKDDYKSNKHKNYIYKDREE